MRCATSVLAALAIASGIMNIIETRLTAIWCPATGVAPRREMKKAMNVKPVTSTRMASAHRHAQAQQAGEARAVAAARRHAAPSAKRR